MIPLKNLDSKSFLEILQEARQHIHRFTDEWTDENYHDPGITLLELSSWLAEMQRYYLNRVTDRNYESLLKLMGIVRKPNGYAETVMHLQGLKKDMEIPKHMKFVADEQIFETRENTYYSHNSIQSVYTCNEELMDVTHLNNQDGINFKLFGERVEEGHGFSIFLKRSLKPGKRIQFYFDIDESYQVPMASDKELLKTFQFKCFQDMHQKYEVEILQDNTQGFRRAGTIAIRLNAEHEPQDMDGIKGYPIYFRALEDSSITPPETNTIWINAANVWNQNTVVDYRIYEESEFTIQHELINFSWQVQGSDDRICWKDIDPENVELDLELELPRIRIHTPYLYYRVTCFDDKQCNQLVIGKGNGVSNYRIRFRTDRIVFDEMILQIAENVGGQYHWYDWHYQKDLIKANPADRVYSYDFEEEELIFGNHEFGLVPENLEQNIRIAKLIKTDYDRGNVKRGHIRRMYAPIHPLELQVTNIKDAMGGSLPQKTAEVHENAYRSYSEITRAITIKNYETLIKKAPGYRISYCKVLNNHQAENQISFVVVPYNGQEKPVLNMEMKSELLRYLEDYRLITTRLDMIDPVYVETSLYATIKVKNRNRFNRQELTERFVERLTPIQGYVVDESYVLGSVPSKADIIEELLLDSEILNVDQISIEGLGLGVRKSVEGELILPENAVIYAKNVVFTVID